MKKILVAALCGLVLAACNNSKPQPVDSGSPPPPPPPSVVAPPPAPTASAPALPTLEVKIASVGNQMVFDTKTLTAAPNQPMHVVFTNKSNMTTMGHNWALVKPGTEASVAANGLKRGEQAGYVDVTDHNMLAFTPMAKAGETVEVTFNAPEEPGVYPYICTFPGHYMMMKGTLTVK